jgi:hypothetical protein
MNDQQVADDEWEEDADEPSRWKDASEFSPKAALGSVGYWEGVEAWWEGPCHGWRIRRFYAASKRYAPKATPDLWARMVQWFIEASASDTDGYVYYMSPAEYDVRSSGWVLDQKAVTRDLPKAFAWATSIVGYSEALDDVLAAPLQNVGLAPHEPLGVDLLPSRSRIDFLDRRNRISRHWPRLCCDCREEFRPRSRTNIRCRACIEQARAARRCSARPTIAKE